MDKYKILVFVGSNTNNSETSAICKKIFKKVYDMFKIEEEKELSIFISSCKDIDAVNCKGCTSCFVKGECPLDVKDNLKILKEKLIAADCIVFASPVYVNFIPGCMKNIIDRLSHWMHTMYLANKTGFILTNTDQSGLNTVEEYLYYIMTQLGICIKGSYSYMFRGKKQEDLENYTTEVSLDMFERLLENKPNINADLESCFMFKKSIYTPYLNKETFGSMTIKYWKEMNLDSLNVFEDYINNIER